MSTQISAIISDQTKAALEKFAKSNGLKKAYLIEEAILHHLQALEQLPMDVVIPAQLSVSKEEGERLLVKLGRNIKPSKNMKALFDES